ncbi:WecB/TagA/CpsF family glycosyltransferase [bacterium]|nr:WecB/TagA/CpsF family glycosyltransferase [bacterium]
MTSPVARPTKLGALARAWLLAGAVCSPATAAAVWVLGLLLGRRRLRGAGSGILTRKLNLLGPSTGAVLGGVTILPGHLNDARLSEKMNLEIPAEEWDRIYTAKVGPKADLSLLLRSIWSSVIDRRQERGIAIADHFNLFDVVVNNSETPLVLRTIAQLVRSHPNLLVQLLKGEGSPDPAPPVHVCFVNANNFNLAIERPEYMKALRAAELVLPDGIGVKLALQMSGGALRRNLNGTDLFPHLAESLASEQWPIFLLGATSEILDRASANIRAKHPGLSIAGMRDGYFKPEDEDALCREINDSGAMALVIGMGTPRQELFVFRNVDRLRVPLVLSMGGLLDFLGEKNRRAPLWMRQTGLEWVFRLLQEPGRMWRRYIIGNPLFLWRVRQWNRNRNTRTLQQAR